MKDVRYEFDWDPAKERINIRRHVVFVNMLNT